jgi:hypothetical protein
MILSAGGLVYPGRGYNGVEGSNMMTKFKKAEELSG